MAADQGRDATSREHVAFDDEPDFRRSRGRARSRDLAGPNLAPGIMRLAYAWTQASTELVVGAVQVAGNLISNLAEDIYEGPVRDGKQGERDGEDRPRRSAAGDAQSASSRRGTRAARREAGGITHVIADELSEALAQSADVLARSADRLSSTYHRTMQDDAVDAAADPERAKEAAAQDQARAKPSKPSNP